MFPKTILAVAFSLVAFHASADDVYRMTLDAPVLFTESSGGSNPPGGGTSNPDGLTIFPPVFPVHATVGDLFDEQIVVTGGGPGVVTDADGEAPEGIDFSGLRAQGTFTEVGAYRFRIVAEDADVPGSEVFSDWIDVGVELPVDASYSSWNDVATIGQTRTNAGPVPSGGLPPYTFSLSEEIEGLSIDESTGQVAFVPTTDGLISFDVVVSDSVDREHRIARSIDAAAPVTLSYDQASYTFNRASTGSISAPVITGGRGTRTVQLISGALPGSMSLSADGSVTGDTGSTLTSGTAYVRAVDAYGRASGSQGISWTVIEPQPLKVWAMIVGGGGAGGHRHGGSSSERGGGGGAAAGEVWVSSLTTDDATAYNISLTPGVSYPIMVGAGGGTSAISAMNGNPSEAFGKRASGGGGGYGSFNGTGYAEGGGAGTRSSQRYAVPEGTNTIPGVPGLSYRQLSGRYGTWAGSGGAGAGTQGGAPSGNDGASGGAGMLVPVGNIANPPISYSVGGGGGGGAGYSGTLKGTGGAHGGGSGGGWNAAGAAGLANTGGGGGGAGSGIYSRVGGAGGSGVVVVSYPGTEVKATGGAITTYADRVVHRFTSSGTFTVH